MIRACWDGPAQRSVPSRRGSSARSDRPHPHVRAGRDRGSASIEFAITAAAIMAIIFAAIQAATYFWARSIALAAAQEGVTAQRAYNAAPGAGHARAESFIAATGDGLTGSTVTVVPGTEHVQVTVTGHCLSVIPRFCNALPVSATAHGTVERVTNP